MLRFWRKRSKAWKKRRTVVPPGEEPRVHDGAKKLVAAVAGYYDGSFDDVGVEIAIALNTYMQSESYKTMACAESTLACMHASALADHVKHSPKTEYDTTFGRISLHDATIDYVFHDYAYDVYVDESAKCVMMEAWMPASYRRRAKHDQRGNTTRICVSPDMFLELFDSDEDEEVE